MSRMTARGGKDAPAFSDVRLRESGAIGHPERVDREQGIIYRVKILGNESPNTHGQHGATKGTRYTRHAREAAKRFYEGAPSNKNHSVPDPKNPHSSDPDRRNGWFTNVRVEEDGTYGDYNLLLSDPLTPKLLEAAERNPKLFSMSHDAYGRGKVVDGWFVVDEILQVESIDVVADGGTCVSLFESRRARPMKTTLRKLLESSKNPKVQAFVKKSHVQRLLEMDGLGASVLDEQAPEEDAATSWRTHLGNLLKAIAEDESMDPKEMQAKAKAALKLLEVGDEEEGQVEESELEESDEGDDDDKKKKKDDDAETKESLKRRLAKLEDMENVRRLCESEQYAATAEEVGRIQKFDTTDDRKWFIGTLKQAKGAGRYESPKSQPPGRMQESRQQAAAGAGEPFKPILRG